MNKYSSQYFDSLFQKIARTFSPEALESMRRAMNDPSIGQAERDAYRRAYERVSHMQPPPQASAPPLPRASSAPPPRPSAPPPPRPSTPPPPPPPPPPPQAASAPSPQSAPSGKTFGGGMPLKNLGRGVGVGVGINMAADALIPKFNEDSYLGQVGNELRSLGIDTAAGAIGGGAMSGGVGALPGAVWGAGANALGKVWQVGSGLNQLLNPWSEHNTYIRESEEAAKNIQKTLAERRLQNQERIHRKAPEPTTAPASAMPPVPTTAPVPAPTPAMVQTNEAPPLAAPIPAKTPIPQPLEQPAPQDVLPAAKPSPLPDPIAPQIPEQAPEPVNTPKQAPKLVQEEVETSKPVSAPAPKVNKPTAYTPPQRRTSPVTPRPTISQQPRPSVLNKNTNVVQNSRMGGALGTVSNLIGRAGDSLQNASRGRLGSGDQRRETSFLPTQSSGQKARPRPKTFGKVR